MQGYFLSHLLALRTPPATLWVVLNAELRGDRIVEAVVVSSTEDEACGNADV